MTSPTAPRDTLDEDSFIAHFLGNHNSATPSSVKECGCATVYITNQVEEAKRQGIEIGMGQMLKRVEADKEELKLNPSGWVIKRAAEIKAQLRKAK